MAKAQKIIGLEPNRSYRINARTILTQKVEEVYTYERFIRDPMRHKELHNMRISIKRLRYTMEFFAVNYNQRHTVDGRTEQTYYQECLATIVDLQEILGDIHDADVAVEVLTTYQKKHEPDALPGIVTLIARTQETRQADYETFLEKWEQLSKTGFKQRLLSFFKR